MKTIVVNKDNLLDKDIDGTITRIKAFIINSNNEILLAIADDCYQLPGGHREENEDINNTLIREIGEETGIDISTTKVTPFFERIQYVKNYRNRGVNKISRIVYFLIRSDEEINEANQHLTEPEKEFNFKVLKIPFVKFEDTIKNQMKLYTKQIHTVIANETIEAFNELQEFLRNKNL